MICYEDGLLKPLKSHFKINVFGVKRDLTKSIIEVGLRLDRFKSASQVSERHDLCSRISERMKTHRG